MLKKTLLLSLSVPAVILAGCSSVTLNPKAAHVIASPSRPPRGCKFLGQVNGTQGNFFTGGWTSNRNLEQGAQNDMRNKAANLGGNYVQLITNRASSTGGSNNLQQTGVTTIGNVYRCPPSLIDE